MWPHIEYDVCMVNIFTRSILNLFHIFNPLRDLGIKWVMMFHQLHLLIIGQSFNVFAIMWKLQQKVSPELLWSFIRVYLQFCGLRYRVNDTASIMSLTLKKYCVCVFIQSQAVLTHCFILYGRVALLLTNQIFKHT